MRRRTLNTRHTETATAKGDDWNELGKTYKQLTVGTSHRPIGVLLERANALLPLSEATSILDNGCGPGPIMSRIIQDYQLPQSCKLICSDFSEGMVQQVRNTKEEKVKEDASSAWSRVETMVQNAMDLKDIPSASQSHVTAGWVGLIEETELHVTETNNSQVYFMTPDPQKCLSESLRVLKDGGVLSCSSWQGSQWMDVMMLLPRIRPDKKNPSMPPEWMEVDKMKGELEKAGFKDVESVQVPTSMGYDRRADFVELCLTKMPPLRASLKDFTEDDMAQLRTLMDEELKKMCPDEPGTLQGVALVATGRK